MQIQLKQLKEDIGGVLPFDYGLDISEIEPRAVGPVRVVGAVRNRAGVLLLELSADGELNFACDRCAKEFTEAVSLDYEVAVADHIMGEECDEILVCEDDILDLDELVSQLFILEIPSKNLCNEDCKGLCPKCGTDLNMSACNCVQKEIDPRLMKLRALLDE